MKKFSSLFIMLFVLFIPRVYAFTYEMDTGFTNKEVTKGSVLEIKVGLKNIQGTSDGIGSCTLNIEFGNNILLDSKIRSLGSWTMTIGNIYLFDTGNITIDDSDLFVIPVKVNGNGSVRIFDIECSDGNTLSSIDDKVISFTVINVNNNGNSSTNNNTNSNNPNNNTNNNTEQKSSNCDLTNIELSEGTIEFNPDVTEYYLEVVNFENLLIEPVLADNKATFSIEKTDDKEIIISVVAEDGTNKVYTLFVKDNIPSDIEEENNNNYVPIFIGIICVLILINIIRLIRNRKNSN